MTCSWSAAAPAGFSTASSLLRRRPSLSIAIVEPRDKHYYQPGWTLVGGGVFDRAKTERAMADVMPKGVKWIRAAVAGFRAGAQRGGSRGRRAAGLSHPGRSARHQARLGRRSTGLKETLAATASPPTISVRDGALHLGTGAGDAGGRALFTQPPMPIKCAGAPQKAMYLACDHWRRKGVLADIDVSFHTAGAVLFGVQGFRAQPDGLCRDGTTPISASTRT